MLQAGKVGFSATVSIGSEQSLGTFNAAVNRDLSALKINAQKLNCIKP